MPRGKAIRRSLRTDPGLEYLAYVPQSGAQDAPVLVSLHGASPNWDRKAAHFFPACEEYGVTLLAPSFRGEDHADYQRLGREGKGVRADLFLHRCLQELASLTNADVARINLFGHSGGAQFAHRYAMAYPHRVAGAVVTAAGWYTFPDQTRKYPYGTRPSRRLPGVVFNPEAFLHVPIHVLVGSADTSIEKVRNSEAIDAQQGRTRLERARNWTTAMRTEAVRHGIPSRISLTEIDGPGHDFVELCERGGLVQRVFRALFEPDADARNAVATPEILVKSA